MATVTITAENLQFVYSQLNFLRNYVGTVPLDWQEYAVPAVAPVVVAPTPVVAAAPVVVAPVAPVAVAVTANVPEVVVATPVKKNYF